MPSKPINSLAFKNKLALSKDAWIQAYSKSDNWPLAQWLQFQKPASGSLVEALQVLHDVQLHYGVSDEKTQSSMVQWIMSFNIFDTTSLNKWDTWSKLFKSTPGWSQKQHAHIFGNMAGKTVTVDPTYYAEMFSVEEHLGPYWNSVRSRIQPRNCSDAGDWETYNTFRREFQTGKLLDHPNTTRWYDFERLGHTTESWKFVLQPLYKAWIEQLPDNAPLGNVTIQYWMNTLDKNGIDASLVALPHFDRPNDYEVWNIPSSWSRGDAEQTLSRVLYLERVSKLYIQEDIRNLGSPDDGHSDDRASALEYSSTVLCWVQTKCFEHASAWSFEQRQALLPLLAASLAVHDYEYISTRTTVHKGLSTWFPEYKEQFNGLRDSMIGLGLDYMEKTKRWDGEVMKRYTGATAASEMVHYLSLIQHLVQPSPVAMSEEIGHLFESESLDMLGL